MLTTFRRRLTLLFAGTTSLILTVIFLIVWVYQNHLYQAQQENLFQNMFRKLCAVTLRNMICIGNINSEKAKEENGNG